MKKLKFCALSLFIALIFLFLLRISPSFWGKIESIFHDIRAQYFIRNPETSSIKVKKGEAKYIQKQKKLKSFQSKIVFVDIDDKSLNQIGKWPWKRTVYSSFIKKIEEFNPSLLLLDIYFPEKSKEDDEFAKTLSNYDNIGCVYNFTKQKNLLIDPATKNNIRKWAIKTNKKDTFKQIKSILPTVHPISDNVFLGHDLMIKGADEKYKKIPEFVIHNGYLYPSITTVLYLKYRGYSVQDLVLEDDEFITRDRIIPVDKKGLRYVDYYISESNRKTFRHISFVDILEEKVKINLEGKIVFVGVTAAGLGSGAQDVLSTPIGEIYGIEFLANALLNIFEDRFIEEVPVVWENIIFLFFSGMIGLLNYKLTGLKNLFITISLVILMFFLSFWLYSLGILINFSKFLIGFFLIYVGITFYKYILEKREKHQIRDMFSSYMSENIVAELIKDPKLAKLQGQKRDMTVLFSDIVGFTSFSEKHAPEYV
ncbi:MAG: CHASE2 domain-containing protein, partial [Candidatus Mcinerneyibacterium aminivorans]